MKATVEDLRKGDVVLIAIGSILSEVKLLRTPQIAKRGKLITWRGNQKWSSVPCVLREETQTHNRWTVTKPVVANGEDYNTEKRIDFTEKVCWIIKREK
jgi:hypothetical protein